MSFDNHEAGIHRNLQRLGLNEEFPAFGLAPPIFPECPQPEISNEAVSSE